jgi:hypothetical protein
MGMKIHGIIANNLPSTLVLDFFADGEKAEDYHGTVFQDENLVGTWRSLRGDWRRQL